MENYNDLYCIFCQQKATITSLAAKIIDRSELLDIYKNQLTVLSKQLSKELEDMNQLIEPSLTKVLSNIVRNYNKNFQQEYERYILNKIEYDEITHMVESLTMELPFLKDQLELDKQILGNLESYLIANFPQEFIPLSYMYSKSKQYYTLQKELDETIHVILYLIPLVERSILITKQAISCSKVDTIFSNCLISNLVKYRNINEAQHIMNKIKRDSTIVNKDLADINLTMNTKINDYSSCTRFFELVLDNLSIDWDIRYDLNSNLVALTNYRTSLDNMLQYLTTRKLEIDRKVEQISL